MNRGEGFSQGKEGTNVWRVISGDTIYGLQDYLRFETYSTEQYYMNQTRFTPCTG